MAVHLSQRSLGEARGDADAQGLPSTTSERPTPCRIKTIEPGFEMSAEIARVHQFELRDDIGQARRRFRMRRLGPCERDGLGGIADVVARQAKQFRVEARRHQFAQRPAHLKRKWQAVGQCGQSPSHDLGPASPEIRLQQAHLALRPGV